MKFPSTLQTVSLSIIFGALVAFGWAIGDVISGSVHVKTFAAVVMMSTMGHFIGQLAMKSYMKRSLDVDNHDKESK